MAGHDEALEDRLVARARDVSEPTSTSSVVALSVKIRLRPCTVSVGEG